MRENTFYKSYYEFNELLYVSICILLLTTALYNLGDCNTIFTSHCSHVLQAVFGNTCIHVLLAQTPPTPQGSTNALQREAQIISE